MTRVPVLPTLVVALAAAAMVALGVWQLERRHEKAAVLARLAANIDRPAIAFPTGPASDAALFRRAVLDCAALRGAASESGRAADGTRGWRVIAECVTPAGAAVPVQLGIAAAPGAVPHRAGGRIAGYVSHAPDHRALIVGVFDRASKRLMLVAADPPTGLRANPPPDLSSVPNNHLAYAVQWFLFAAIAVVVYTLALRRRRPS